MRQCGSRRLADFCRDSGWVGCQLLSFHIVYQLYISLTLKEIFDKLIEKIVNPYLKYVYFEKKGTSN